MRTNIDTSSSGPSWTAARAYGSSWTSPGPGVSMGAAPAAPIQAQYATAPNVVQGSLLSSGSTSTNASTDAS
eukprot:66438-Rhodomonas_salina.1